MSTPNQAEHDAVAPSRDGVVVSIGRDTYRTQVRVGPHTLVADEPASLGGTDLGPTPQELLLASLAACKAITLRMYADRKGWPIEQIACVARHASPDDAGSVIEVELEVVGALDQAQRARLVEIAERCPVQRTITGELRVVTTLVGES